MDWYYHMISSELITTQFRCHKMKRFSHHPFHWYTHDDDAIITFTKEENINNQTCSDLDRTGRALTWLKCLVLEVLLCRYCNWLPRSSSISTTSKTHTMTSRRCIPRSWTPWEFFRPWVLCPHLETHGSPTSTLLVGKMARYHNSDRCLSDWLYCWAQVVEQENCSSIRFEKARYKT